MSQQVLKLFKIIGTQIMYHQKIQTKPINEGSHQIEDMTASHIQL